MESSLHGVWESAVGNSFVPTIGKDSQFTVGFSLLVLGILLSGFFGLSEFIFLILLINLLKAKQIALSSTFLSLVFQLQQLLRKLSLLILQRT